MKKRFPAASLVILLLLFADTLVSSLVISRSDKRLGWLLLIPAAVLIVLCIVLTLYYTRNTMRHISRMNEQLESSAAEYMNSLPAPVAVINDKREFVWYNRTFTERISSGEDLYGCDAGSSITMNFDALAEDGSAMCTVHDRVYRVTAEKFDKNDISFLVLYFHDETDFRKLKQQSDESHPNVVIISIDNYDEIMQDAKESEKSQASAAADQLLENFISRTNGFVKKCSGNVFYAVIENRHLNSIIDEQFRILDEARNIKAAGKFPLTFSIGVGYGADSLAESEKAARQCLDMALGRGGDQAVVKTDGGYKFFGGVSKGMEKKSRAKTRVIANALQDLIMNSETIYLMGHRFGDLDAVGASCGMAGAVAMLGKETHIAVDRIRNLASHLIDIVEEATDDTLFITPEDALAEITDRDLLIIVDTHNKDFLESKALYEKAKSVVVIDHHRKTANFIDDAVLFHHEPYASSASEMVTEVIQYFNFPDEEKLAPCHADALLAGIMLDTKNFVMRTGVRTFEAAAFLKKLGADTVAVKLLFSNSIESYKRKTQIVASADVHNRCAIAEANFESDDIRLVAPQAADELLGITDVIASFVIYKTGRTMNISARSLGALNVQVIMEKLGGGGHQTMAAAQLEGVTCDEAAEKLKAVIDELHLEEQE